MRDAIATGIALILVTIAASLLVIFATEYARAEGWFEPASERSIYIQPADNPD
jgi:hypothetical protein